MLFYLNVWSILLKSAPKNHPGITSACKKARIAPGTFVWRSLEIRVEADLLGIGVLFLVEDPCFLVL